MSVLHILRDLANDAVMFLRSSFHSRTALIAENLFLRKQLTFYREHQVRPRRLTNAARLSLVFWSRFFQWKSALLIVKPATLIGWHRKAFRLFWKFGSLVASVVRGCRPSFSKGSREWFMTIRPGAKGASPMSFG